MRNELPAMGFLLVDCLDMKKTMEKISQIQTFLHYDYFGGKV